MSIDSSKHSLFGAAKIAADIIVPEYGRYFQLRTGVFAGVVA
jgi:CDP-paratose 2-epimerase